MCCIDRLKSQPESRRSPALVKGASNKCSRPEGRVNSSGGKLLADSSNQACSLEVQ